MKKNIFIPLVFIISICFIVLIIYSINLNNKTSTKNKQQIEEPYQKNISNKQEIIEKNNPLPDSLIQLNIKEYTEDYSEDLKYKKENILNLDKFQFSEDAMQKLLRNGFVVIPSYSSEFHHLFEGDNRYNNIPNFVTTDSVLHTYHLFFDYILQNTEQTKLYDVLVSLTDGVYEESLNSLAELEESTWESSAKDNVAYFSVAKKILNPEFTPLDIVKDIALSEYNNIMQESGIKKSPLTQQEEDYSQYKVRGHYTTSNILKKYFKTMMFYGRAQYPLQTDKYVKNSIIMSTNLSNHIKDWKTIYDITNFFVGNTDDINPQDIKQILDKKYNTNTTIKYLLNNNIDIAEINKEIAKLNSPKINSKISFILGDYNEDEKYFRLMGQRFIFDSYILQELVSEKVPTRKIPRALDIIAAMGSDEALNILEKQGETKYEKYNSQMTKLRKEVKDISLSTWTQNLYWNILHVFNGLLEEKSSTYPAFMRTKAWARKELTTYLGAWTELRHDTILYAKQVYAELGGHIEEDSSVRYDSYVEPNPALYNRLYEVVIKTKDILKEKNLISKEVEESLNIFGELVYQLKVISDKELSNKKLTQKEKDLLSSFGGQLEHFYYLISNGLHKLDDNTNGDIEKTNEVIADVATGTHGSGEVVILEEATGRVFKICVLLPYNNKTYIAAGGVYSHYEFLQKLSDGRLTDQEWKQMVSSRTIPELAQWTDIYIGK